MKSPHFSIQHFQSPLKTRKVHKLFYRQKRLICCLKCWHKHQTWINSHHFLSYIINACTQQMDQDMHTIPKSFTFQGLTKSWIFLTLRVLLLTFCVEWCTSVNKRHWCYHSHPPKTKSCSSEKKEKKKKWGKGCYCWSRLLAVYADHHTKIAVIAATNSLCSSGPFQTPAWLISKVKSGLMFSVFSPLLWAWKANVPNVENRKYFQKNKENPSANFFFWIIGSIFIRRFIIYDTTFSIWEV